MRKLVYSTKCAFTSDDLLAVECGCKAGCKNEGPTREGEEKICCTHGATVPLLLSLSQYESLSTTFSWIWEPECIRLKSSLPWFLTSKQIFVIILNYWWLRLVTKLTIWIQWHPYPPGYRPLRCRPTSPLKPEGLEATTPRRLRSARNESRKNNKTRGSTTKSGTNLQLETPNRGGCNRCRIQKLKIIDRRDCNVSAHRDEMCWQDLGKIRSRVIQIRITHGHTNL
jgi:hypothetical protein